MKKVTFILSFFFVFILLTSCDNAPETSTTSHLDEHETVHVMMPAGAPTLGFVKMIHEHDQLLNYPIEYDSRSGVDPLVAAMTSGTHDIVVAPTNVGAKLFKGNGDYVFAGTITFGNLYLVSNQDISLSDLSNQTINFFGSGGTPEILLKKVLEDKTDLQYQSFNSVNDVSSMFLASSDLNISLLAEPILSIVKTKTNDVYIVADLQEEYENLTNQSSYPQAGVFIKKDFVMNNRAFVDEFISKLSESAQFVNDEKEQAVAYYASLFPNQPLSKNTEALMRSIPGSNIRFKDSVESKNLIEDYFQIIIGFNPALIGGDELPGEDFYLE